jgi:diacylglycerol kinase (ATP)
VKFSIGARIKSFRYAFDGIASMVKNEHNSRIHIIAAILVILLGIISRISPGEWIALIIVMGLVFITELINSAIEDLADLVDSNENKAIKQIKDYAAASVLIASLIAIITGALIFIPDLLGHIG